MSMTCGLCKRQIRGDEKYTTDHYRCGADLTASWRDDLTKVEAQRDKLRAALAALVGASERSELEQLELVMRTLPAPAEDKAVSIDAIHVLLATVEGTNHSDICYCRKQPCICNARPHWQYHDDECESELTSHGYTPCRCDERLSARKDGEHKYGRASDAKAEGR